MSSLSAIVGAPIHLPNAAFSDAALENDAKAIGNDHEGMMRVTEAALKGIRANWINLYWAPIWHQNRAV